MNYPLLLSMAAFALAASISPGPVNIVALSSGMRYGMRRSLSHVLGASLGFVLLLLVKWAGAAFLLYMAYGLASDRGMIDGNSGVGPPSVLQAATMQWLNPKAWLASMAGVGAFTLDGAAFGLPVFAFVYGIVCYVSIAVWAAAGAGMGNWVQNPGILKIVNRCLAVLLAASAVYLIAENITMLPDL